jgi:hypothetical protein
MRSFWVRCRRQLKQATNFRFELSRAQKSAASFPAALFIFTDGCGRSRLKFSRLSFPADKATSRSAGGSSVSSTSFFETAACDASFGFALQRNDSSDNYTSFREHFSHNGNCSSKKPTHEEKYALRRLLILDRNELSGSSYGRANKQTTRPCRRIAVSDLSSCLISAFSRSVRIPD